MKILRRISLIGFFVGTLLLVLGCEEMVDPANTTSEV